MIRSRTEIRTAWLWKATGADLDSVSTGAFGEHRVPGTLRCRVAGGRILGQWGGAARGRCPGSGAPPLGGGKMGLLARGSEDLFHVMPPRGKVSCSGVVTGL